MCLSGRNLLASAARAILDRLTPREVTFQNVALKYQSSMERRKDGLFLRVPTCSLGGSIEKDDDLQYRTVRIARMGDVFELYSEKLKETRAAW